MTEHEAPGEELVNQRWRCRKSTVEDGQAGASAVAARPAVEEGRGTMIGFEHEELINPVVVHTRTTCRVTPHPYVKTRPGPERKRKI
jgi:hypothetical protein